MYHSKFLMKIILVIFVVILPNCSSDTGTTSPPDIPHDIPETAVIAFVSDRFGYLDIYSMNTDGSEQTRLTNTQNIDWNPVFSPNGDKIAYESETSDGNREIYIMNSDGSEPTNITNNQSDDWGPVFQP